MYKKAEMGIGTLIIFIAMILVAAIAAAVLIQTAGSLQSKALLTGERTKSQISTSLQITQIYAENGSDTGADSHKLKNFFVTAKLAPGSETIKLNDTLINVNLRDKSADLRYGGTVCSASAAAGDVGAGYHYAATGFHINRTTGVGNYTITYLINGESHISGYLVRGDVVKFCLRAPKNITEDEKMTFSVVPKIGSTAIVETMTPQVINDEKMYLFP